MKVCDHIFVDIFIDESVVCVDNGGNDFSAMLFSTILHVY